MQENNSCNITWPSLSPLVPIYFILLHLFLPTQIIHLLSAFIFISIINALSMLVWIVTG